MRTGHSGHTLGTGNGEAPPGAVGERWLRTPKQLSNGVGYAINGQTTVSCAGAAAATCGELWVFTVANDEVRAERHTGNCGPVT